MSRKVTTSVASLIGLAGMAGFGYFGLGMAGGTIPAIPANTIQASLLSFLGAGGIGIAGLSLFARHLALVVLACTDLANADNMAMIQKLAANDPGATKPATPDTKQLAKEVAAHLAGN